MLHNNIFITHHSSFINHQSSIIDHQSSINHQSPFINHQSSVTNHQSSITNHQASNIKHQSSIIIHQSSINHQSPYFLKVVESRKTCFFTKSVRFGRTELSIWRGFGKRWEFSLSGVPGPLFENADGELNLHIFWRWKKYKSDKGCSLEL